MPSKLLKKLTWNMNSTPKNHEKSLLNELKGRGLGRLTVDDFLGGKVRLIQFKEGYRAGMDAVLLAASIPAALGERALDLGAATGAAALCLAARCPGVFVDGLEIQENLVTLAKSNIALNNAAEQVTIYPGDFAARPAAIPENSYDHVLANPPYLEEGEAISPPAKTKGIAYIGGASKLEDWVKFAVSRVKNKGTLSFIFRGDRIGELCHLLHRRAGELVIFPLWPHVGEPAKRVLVQARKGLHGAATIAPGLALHGTHERYSKAAEAVLRGGEAIDLWQYHRAKKPKATP